MNPEKSGWLKEYISFREKLPKREVVFGKHPDESLYRMVQPTGIMYGQPVNAVEHPDMNSWNSRSKMKVLLLESILNSSYLFQQQESNYSGDINDIIRKIGDFYIDVYPDFSISKKSFFGKKKDSIEIAEKVIDKRIDLNFEQEQNFWSRFFNNSLLFVDIYLFGQWIHTEGDRMVVEFLREEKTKLYTTVCKVMASAAHSNKNIEDEERRLFALFVNSTGLNNEEKKIAIALFEKGLSLLEVGIGNNIPWIVKKYFLELASLTIWADKKVEESEVAFLTELSDLLGFNEDDFENSMVAVEAFVIKHWQELDYLQTKRNFEIVSERFINRIARIIEKNSFRMTKAIKEDAELVILLRKSIIKEPDAAEKAEIEKRFINALKSIPSFKIIELPEKFLNYKLMKRVISKNIINDLMTDDQKV